MARKIRWSRAAVEDLEQAALYIERDSPAYATEFVERIFAAVHSLTSFPERFAPVEELRLPTIRQDFVAGYRLIFEIEKDVIQVLRLIHAARDFDTAWAQRKPK